jgi:hypothetical protein
LTRRQAVEQIVAQLDGPIEVNELCRRVLDIAPSRAKKPLAAVRNHVRQEHIGRSVIFLDAKTVLPLRLAMKGVRFRVPVSRREADQGVLIIYPAFQYFLRQELEPDSIQLREAKGNHPLPVRLTTVRERVETPFGKQVVDHPAFDLGRWFDREGVRRKDSVLVTIENWEEGRFRLKHEPAKHQREEEIARRDQELSDILFDLLEKARNEVVYGPEAIATAYALMSSPGGYPGNHWIEVVHHDPRMRYDGSWIRYSDWRSPLESMFQEDEPVPQVEFSREQGRKVYRFKASLWRRSGLWRVIEIQGEQTLADFDGILRDAFQHDVFDHLGGFWKRIRRGDSKRFREVDIGTVNPFEGGEGAEVAIAGLELEPGQELKYVYDFGDWIEHRIVLEEIVEPEKDAVYPRIVDQNKPRYRNCESCRAQGRKRRATWICLKCSAEQERDVLICEDCLDREHMDHYAEEILY